MANFVTEAMAGSPAFRRLVTRVDELHGIVYIDATHVVQTEARRILVGALQHRVTVAGDYRLLHVIVAPSSSSRVTIPTLAHELQHVVEVLESGATTERAIDRLFDRIGMQVGARLTETEAALAVQRTVANEMFSGR